MDSINISSWLENERARRLCTLTIHEKSKRCRKQGRG